jgi:YfiH family protein
VLERSIGKNGLAYFISPKLRALGVRHAFSTRLGGISKPPFDSLNMGNPNGVPVQDDYANIWENYRRLLVEIDCPPGPPIRVHQIHGNEVAEVREGEDFDTACKADAIVTEDGHRPISVRIADCLPVLISSKDGKMVAAVHAGWRGIVAGVIPAATERMLAFRPDLQAGDFVAALGPCIGLQAFEVGPEVIAEFQWLPNPPVLTDSGKGHVDLREAARIQLIAAGLKADAIDSAGDSSGGSTGDSTGDSTDLCTFSNRAEFFSHRRDNGITGRMTAIIVPNRS